jgi:DNA-binding transcriptional regulator YiaG
MSTTGVSRLLEVRRLAESGEARGLRQRARLSLAEIAAACDVDTATVWRWETGRRRPRGSMAMRYLDVLDQLRECA